MNVVDLNDDCIMEIKSGDKVYRLRDPKVSEVEGFDKTNPEKALATFSELLVKLGLPKEVCDGLGVGALRKVLEAFTDSLVDKKKSD